MKVWCCNRKTLYFRDGNDKRNLLQPTAALVYNVDNVATDDFVAVIFKLAAKSMLQTLPRRCNFQNLISDTVSQSTITPHPPLIEEALAMNPGQYSALDVTVV
ncbi:hypothetical protein CHS0354_014151 [Potamilus streckersoni]|uniref:Uncharacterized protein n=1 Tax=Potamilus streckersoni TaxID=2493646 RepID=A0AAE0TLJ2_9BIVA|nr:hypothetical protein CHS0354_014151 [Potamilus streckersoni]